MSPSPRFTTANRGKRTPTAIELLLQELRAIGLTRLNAIGRGTISNLVARIELEEKDKRLAEIDRIEKGGYTY